MDSPFTRHSSICIVRRWVGHTAAGVALKTSRVDCCNCVLVGLPKSTVEPLHRIQNAAAWLLFSLGHFHHVMLSQIRLNWLQVSYRVKFSSNFAALFMPSTMIVVRRIWWKLYSHSVPAGQVLDFVFVHLSPHWLTIPVPGVHEFWRARVFSRGCCHVELTTSALHQSDRLTDSGLSFRLWKLLKSLFLDCF